MAWQEHTRTYFPGVQSLSFDAHAELLWTGLVSGHVSSHFTKPEYHYSRYTAYKAHLRGPPRELTVDDRGVLSVGGSVKLATKRGVALWNVHDTESLVSACYSNAASSEIVAGGASHTGVHPDLLCINASTGTVLRREASYAAISYVRRSHLVCCGQADGRIVLRDPKTLRAEQTIPAHLNGLSGLEAQGNYLYSLGYSIRHGVPVVDPIVKIFDVRALRPLPPISFASLPAFVQPHPRDPNTVIIASAQGHFQTTDINNPTSIQFANVETGSYLTAMTIAPTGEGLAFADAEGLLHIWATPSPSEEEPHFARFDNPIEMPDTPEPVKPVNWTADTPLSMIGMPFYESQLLSVIPWEQYSSKYSPFGQPPRPIDPTVLSTMKTVDFVGYAVNPRGNKRNVATLQGVKAKDAKRKMDVPLFRSEKERERSSRRRQRKKSEPLLQDTDTDGEEADAQAMPKYYRKVEIKYSRFGVEDFDFAFYNKTKYSGLETHILNSYTNALLQVLRFMQPIRELAEGHTRTACAKETCLLCEAGFLFKMLRDAKGSNCQANNFSKAFSGNQQAAALGLMDIDDTSSQAAYSSLIQTFNRFLLETMSVECDRYPKNRQVKTTEFAETIPPPSPLSQLLGLNIRTTSTCGTCGHQVSRESSSNVLDLVYPRKALSNEVQPVTDFATIFKSAIARENVSKTSCPGCRQMTNTRVKRHLTGSPLPPLLAVNAAVHTPDQMEVWLDGRIRKDKGPFLKPRVAISPLGDSVTPLSEGQSPRNSDDVVYQLQALVVQIQTEDDPAHLVSIINVPSTEGGTAGWHVFNDFLVRPITEEEALGFAGTWKIPAILYYQRTDIDQVLDRSTLEVPVDKSILMTDVSISKHRRNDFIKHRVLKESELPRPGTLVSIDAEFVALQQEEVEYRSDGTKSIIRPSRMTLARVSVLRGEGENTGIPFIDDHILVNEPIVDYLTEFSGIRQGDLDAMKSHHTLVPGKVAYKKLRLLVDLGCVFIGHGLNKDFRIINIHVPASQIIDTVNIYHLAHRHRKISLRFLSWVVLNQDIQSSGSHDSIEDARTALQLFEKHSQLEHEGEWETTLEDIYREGGRLNWKVPGADKAPHSPPMGNSQQLPPQGLPSDALPMAMNRLII